MLLEPKEIDINGKAFILSKLPAVQAREIISKYPVANMPKLGDYKVSEETMLKLMKYVAVPVEGREPLQLMSIDLINNHVPNWEVLVQLEWWMLEYNCSFFQNGKALNFLDKLKVLAQQNVSEMLTGLLDKSSRAEKQPSTN